MCVDRSRCPFFRMFLHTSLRAHLHLENRADFFKRGWQSP
uniref:Uncharacterized protein n=1 Tax=Anguilla anguilla TaxID=7936 RepID=A0A0E9PB33_ANGAN